MKNKLEDIAASFGYPENISVKRLEKGLINKTFLVESINQKPVLIQQINTSVFKKPQDVQDNYQLIYEQVQRKNFFIPAPVKTVAGSLLVETEEGECWRAFEFVPDSYSPDLIRNHDDARLVAACFGRFVSLFNDFDINRLKPVIPHFHDLSFRFLELENAIRDTRSEVSGEVVELITELQKRKFIRQWYRTFSDEAGFPLRVMHHDCKISNILFDRTSQQLICPVDMDTVMPGKFFSDPGDMIRTMCCSRDENSTEWDEIFIREDYYPVLLTAYKEAIAGLFTKTELSCLHYSGLIIIYMQALRFLTDHLNGNIYYRTDYEEQNFHRAKNQFLLLKSLEQYLRKHHGLDLP